jgi:large subunit ribosomal protein L9
MAKDIEVILTQDSKTIGKLGQKKRVKAGFARNFLLPRGLAMVVTEGNLLQFKAVEKKELKRRAKEKEAAQEIEKILSGKTVTLSAKTHANGKLYGSVTPAKVLEHLHKDSKVSLDKHKLVMPEHIKDAGKYEVSIELHPEVTVKIGLVIKPIADSDEKKASK